MLIRLKRVPPRLPDQTNLQAEAQRRSIQATGASAGGCVWLGKKWEINLSRLHRAYGERDKVPPYNPLVSLHAH
jgi:hypothetical protein